MDSLIKQTYDNITVVMLAFANFKMAVTNSTEKDDSPGYYLSYEKQLKTYQRSTTEIKAKSNANSRVILESRDVDKAHKKNESFSITKTQHKLDMSLLSEIKTKNGTGTKQLIKAYRKVNLVPVAK